MKQLLTIFLLCNMLLLQYSRQAAYLQCKVSNALLARHCDCEKIIAEDDHQTGSHERLPAGTLKMNMPDEAFLHAQALSASFSFFEAKQKPTAFINIFHPQQFAKELVQPPNA